ncbi:bifunctional ADP-dependent NAD(P)H-hydrate dehydratase/NAD(P)H-hydrate epimerase [Kineobactrum sediminis]|uniref:Bifunctional NAD(P)H-hydrate repair enzyme n=2 Tax=Kineobactrum sediminis TaxID=1905677 RepID=A0A2N5Y0J4_9GAMM|nr:bifunctional ADP-dependent NAD(P)H-hydrate dehydratase/NAD(P)H-hydrate epimerase [Kineobactrum sediminis]
MQLEALYSAEQTRALDRCAIENHGISGAVLMSRAAATALDHLLLRWPHPLLLQILCGTGNNGGDGYLLADQAHKRGIPVQVWQLGDAGKMRGDALLARQQALANGVAVAAFHPGALRAEGVLIDAMLGTGLTGEVRAPFSEAITLCNQSGLPLLAVDIPSGLCADTGRRLGATTRADMTVTFIGYKRGLFTLDGPDCCGILVFADLGVPAEVYRQSAPDWLRLDLDLLLAQLPSRPANAHKGNYGTVLVVGGDYGMGGAVALAAEAALRAGAGLVRVATRAEHVAAVIARTPEAMPVSVGSGQALKPLVDSADVLVVGPGLGQSPWSEQLVQTIAESGKPCVLDADGLNMLAAGRVLSPRVRDNWVFTPHPGEAARLLGCSTAQVQADRFAATKRLQERLGGVVILKGNGSLVTDGTRGLLCDYGNPGMASGGMGDVLSGVIGGLLAQDLVGLDAAALAVCLHGAAADIASEQGQKGLLAGDLMVPLRALLG